MKSRRFSFLIAPALALLAGALYLGVLLAQTPHFNDNFERLVSTGIVVLIFLLAYRAQRRFAQIAAERDANGRLVAEMRNLEKFRREFVANVAHELRTPLTGIRGAVDVLVEDATLSGEDRAAMFGVLREQTARLDRLSQDILSLAEIERAQASDTRELEMCDLSHVVANAVALMEPKASALGVRLVLARNDSFHANCDAGLLEEAVENLVENALRYSESDDVVVTLAAEGDRARITVADHGVGIAPEHQKRIFERFYRVDKTRSRSHCGTGLGLAIVKHIARLHGGDVALESQTGHGCRFSIILPSRADVICRER